MTKEFSRTEQLASLMQRELSIIIQNKVTDPRIDKLVSVSGVKVTRDLSFAKVYISLLDTDEKKIEDVIKVLNHASGFIKTLLSHEIQVRKVPQLTFVYDASITYGSRLSKLIDDARADDEDSGVDS